MKKLDKENWPLVRFGEVARILNESERDPLAAGLTRYVGLEHIDSGSLHLRAWGNVVDGTTFTRTFREGNVLFGKRRAYQRKAAVANFNGLCSGDILVMEANEKRLLPALLPFLVHSDGFFDHAVRTSAGSLSPRTKFKDLAEYEFRLPPREQQQQLAELLRAADEVGEKQRETQVQTQAYAKLWTDLAFSAPEQGFSAYESLALQDCCKLQTGVAKGKQYEAHIETVTMPYLSVSNVQDGRVDLSVVKEITIASKDVKRFSLKAGDVLLTEGGDFDKLGRGTVWNGEIEDCLHQNHVFCVRPDEEKVLPEFVSAQTSSAYGKTYFLMNAKKTSNLASINSTQVKGFPMIVPSIGEQEAFIEKLNLLKNSIEQTGKQVALAETVKQQLINQIFSA